MKSLNWPSYQKIWLIVELSSFRIFCRTSYSGKFLQTEQSPGESAKEIESELGTLARKFGNSPDADQQLMGDAIMQAQGIVKQLIRRSNPEAAAPLDAANAAYAKFLRVERAAGGLGAKQGETPGVFSPAQFRSSVRATDPSRNKRQFARGNALSQKLAETGEEVLGNVVPDFGTAGRGMMGAMLLGGGSGYFIDPAIAAASLAGSSIYTRPGISLVNRLLSRPSAVQVAGARARPYAPGMVPGEGRLQDEPTSAIPFSTGIASPVDTVAREKPVPLKNQFLSLN